MMNKYTTYKLPGDILLETAQKHRQMRRQTKLSQVELAKRFGVSLGSLKRFEKSGQISFESLLKLAHVLGALDGFENIFQHKEDRSRIEQLFSKELRGGKK
jgi:transcriptional regulator with XRE-family HTH domain